MRAVRTVDDLARPLPVMCKMSISDDYKHPIAPPS